MKTNQHKYLFFAVLLIYFFFGHLSFAANDNHKLSAADERKFDYFFFEGLKLKHAGKFDASFEMFSHCLAIDSTSSVVLYELSSFFMNLDKPEKAVAYLKKAINYAPNNQEYRNTLASLFFSLSQFEEAAGEFELLLKSHPEKPELNYYLAESYSRMGEIQKAIDMYNELENVTGLNEALSMEKFQLYMKLKQEEKSMDEIKKLIEKYPMESRYLTFLGDLFLQQNNHSQALFYYRKAQEVDSESPYYPVSMANYYEKTGQRDSAKMQITAALMNERLDVNTKLSILARFIHQLQTSSQDIDGADVMFQTLLNQHPDESRLKMVYAMFLSSLKKFDEARFQISLVTESEPENKEAWLQLLELARQTKDFDEAIRISEKCREIFPEEIEFHYYLGMVYYQKKEYKSAIATYKEAIPLIPAGNKKLISDFYSMIGDAYFKLRETDKAFKAYDEAIKNNDKNAMALNNYAYYLSLLKQDLAKAERMSALTVKMEPENATYIDTYAWIFFKQGNFPLAKLYIERAIANDKTNSAELADHYGDILYFSGEAEKAVEQWIKAKEAGKNTPTVLKKIAGKTYFEETEDELFNDVDEDIQ